MNPEDPSKDAATQPQHDRQPSPTYQERAPAQPVRSTPAPEPQPQPSQEPERPLYHADDTVTPAEPQQQSYAAGFPTAPAPQPHPQRTGSVDWTASEFIAHDKDPGWYAVLAGITAVVAGIAYLITRDFFTPVIMVIAGILFGVAAHRPPREMRYGVDDHGVSIGSKKYPYGDFRAFSVQQEGPLKSITFMPLKRFMPMLSMYYDPADEDEIAKVLTAHLPMQDHPNDPIEKLMKRIRF